MTERLGRIGVLAVLAAMGCAAQTATGSIAGTVKDATGAVVPSASITLTSTGTNQVRVTQSNGSGYYSFPLLPPATYDLRAEAAGFKTFLRTGMKLDVALSLTVDAVLELGSPAESITVNAEAPPLESSTSSLGHLMENSRIVNLPVNGRNSYGFAALVPGVRASRGFTQVAYGMYNDQFISINGSRPNQSNFQMDGGTNSNSAFNGPGVFPSVDMVEEYKVQTNNFSAEYTNTAGGVVNLVTKSGTNAFHGSLFEFLRNEKLTANDFFSNRQGLPKAPFRFNQFGGTLGGPVIVPGVYNGRNKTFFFVSYEGLRWARALTATGTMPTDLERMGDFSETRDQAGRLVTIYDPETTVPDPARPGRFLRTPFPGNVIPRNRFDPLSARFLTLTPRANGPGNPLTRTNNFIVNSSAPIVKDTQSYRIDHSFTDTRRLFGRYTGNETGVTRPATYGEELRLSAPSLGDDTLKQKSAVLNYSQTLTPTAVLELSSSFLRYTLKRVTAGAGYDPVQLGFPSYFRELQPALVPFFPQVSVTGMGVSYNVPDNGGGFLGVGGAPPDAGYDTFYEYGNLTLVRGKHTLKMGGNFGVNRLSDRRATNAVHSYSFGPGFTQGPDPIVASTNGGSAVASFLLGLGTGNINSDGPGQSISFRYWGGYFQDDWRITPSLTLNLGVRYDFNHPWTERFNRIASIDFDSPSPLQTSLGPLRGGLTFPGVGGLSRGHFDADRNNVAPRVGFAWTVNSRTVLRGGYGIFSAPIQGEAFNGSIPISGFESSTAWVSSLDGVTPQNYLRDPYPGGFQRASGSERGLLTQLGQGISGLDRSRTTPYAQQWNLNVQRTLPGRLLLDAAYAGSRGLHLFGNLDYNTLPNELLSMGDALRQLVPNPFYGLVSTGTLAAPQVQRGQLLRPYPQFTGFLSTNTSYGASTYHALQAKLERRFSSGFSLLVSYTFSKLMDDVAATGRGLPGDAIGSEAIQDFRNRRNERSVASFDTPHYLAISSVAELPFGKGKPFLNGRGVLPLLFGNWQMNGIAVVKTGTPLGVRVSQNTLFNYGGVQRPNWNGQDPSLDGPVSSRVNRYFDTSAFTQPAPYTFGNTPRTLAFLRAPGTQNLDASLFRNIPIREQIRLQFRAEVFNVFNHPEFGPPNTVIGSANAGVISTQVNSPRDIQLALKLLF